MNHPLRENLEVASADGSEWVRCKPCQHKYCRTDQDWRQFAKARAPMALALSGVFSSASRSVRRSTIFDVAMPLTTGTISNVSTDAGITCVKARAARPIACDSES